METLIAETLDELKNLAIKLAPKLPRGVIIGLTGELGAGKTTLVQALCEALKIEDTVVSPTYSIENRYQGNDLTVHHLDLFRLKTDSDVEFLFDLVGDSKKLLLVEWPERVPQVSKAVGYKIEINTLENSAREIRIFPVD